MDAIDALTLTPTPSPDGVSGDELSDSSLNLSSSFINAENYITIKEGCQSAFTIDELTEAVSRCKKLVLESEQCSDERKWFVRRLIELRHRLEQAKENENAKPTSEIQETLVRLGHNFKIQPPPNPSAKKLYCDHCCGAIWKVVQSYYRCVDCRYKCHEKCSQLFHRVCPTLMLSESPKYEDRICPEEGLDKQFYKCEECHARISFTLSKGYLGNPFSSANSLMEARRCDYNGKYYCRNCHWGTSSVVPARIMHNWEFEPQMVCRASYQMIKMSRHRPLIALDSRIYSKIDDLRTIKAELVKELLTKAQTPTEKASDFERILRSFGQTELITIEQTVFSGFIIGRIICPFIVLKVNNKYLILSGVAFEILCCGLFQHLVIYLHYFAFISLAALVYLAQSLHYPVAVNILAKWMPPNEYTRSAAGINAGDIFARAMLNQISMRSDLASLLVVFNVFAVFKLVWCVAYLIVGAQDPQTSFLIRKREWDFLSKEIGPRKKVNCSMKVPWKNILTCPRLYASIFCEIANKWHFIAVKFWSAYCPDVDITDASISLIFLPFTSYGAAWLIDVMIEKYYITRNNARKIINTIALWGAALCLAFMCYFYTNHDKVVFFLILSQYLMGLTECGQLPSMLDLSPNYAAVLFCLYMIPGWGSVVVRAQLSYYYISSESSLKRSLPVFYETALVMFVFNYAFLMLGDITLLKFDEYDTHDWRKESKMREEMLHMKHYIATCRIALETGFLKELDWGNSLIHSTESFSLDNLIQIKNGTFIPQIEAIHNRLRTHIKETCDVCKGRGFMCYTCRHLENIPPIYPFDAETWICPQCSDVRHMHCALNQKSCHKCERKNLLSSE